MMVRDVFYLVPFGKDQRHFTGAPSQIFKTAESRVPPVHLHLASSRRAFS